MSHHGDQHPDPEQIKAINELLRKSQATQEGEYPQGRLNRDDAGAVALAVGVESGSVVIRFPKRIEWIGFTPQQAMELASLLVRNARKAGSKEPLTIELG